MVGAEAPAAIICVVDKAGDGQGQCCIVREFHGDLTIVTAVNRRLAARARSFAAGLGLANHEFLDLVTGL